MEDSYWTEECSKCEICNDPDAEPEENSGCNGFCPDCFPYVDGI